MIFMVLNCRFFRDIAIFIFKMRIYHSWASCESSIPWFLRVSLSRAYTRQRARLTRLDRYYWNVDVKRLTTNSNIYIYIYCCNAIWEIFTGAAFSDSWLELGSGTLCLSHLTFTYLLCTRCKINQSRERDRDFFLTLFLFIFVRLHYL